MATSLLLIAAAVVVVVVVVVVVAVATAAAVVVFVIFSFSGDAEIGKFYVRKGNGTAPGNHIIRMSPPPNEHLKIDVDNLKHVY